MLKITKIPSRHDIACVNWPEAFPYKPQVSVELSHSGDCLHIRYNVCEKAVRGVCAADREHAWEDSCVEFFFAPREDGQYYNVECTCTGKIYMCVGADRHERQFLPEEAYSSIRRRPSLGSAPVGLIGQTTEWSVGLDIPASVFGLESFSGLKARGNFYKCGDLLPERHFVSMFPIGTPKPDFHRPEYFEVIEFE